MTTIKDIFNFTESFAPVSSAMDNDNCGLLIGDFETAVTNVLVALDITADVIKEAKENNSELIISHHPVIFNPIKSMNTSSVPYLLAKNSIAALCIHTNLDFSQLFGVNLELANALGLSDIQFTEFEGFATGFLEKEMASDKFALYVKEKLDCNGVRFTQSNNKIKKVALSCGSGGYNIINCPNVKADALVTGEIKHHEIIQANALNVTVVEAGHFKSEDVVILPLVKKLKNKFENVIFTKSKTFTDSVNYL